MGPPSIILIHLMTQFASSYLSKRPNHLSLCLPNTMLIPMLTLLLSSSLDSLSARDAPHIHLIILTSARSICWMCPTPMGHVSQPYTMKLQSSQVVYYLAHHLQGLRRWCQFFFSIRSSCVMSMLHPACHPVSSYMSPQTSGPASLFLTL